MTNNRNALFDISNKVTDESLKNFREQGLIPVAVPFSRGASFYAPAKSGPSKGYHRIKLEVWVPEDAIEGEGALGDGFSGFALIGLPKDRVKDHLKHPEGLVSGGERVVSMSMPGLGVGTVVGIDPKDPLRAIVSFSDDESTISLPISSLQRIDNE